MAPTLFTEKQIEDPQAYAHLKLSINFFAKIRFEALGALAFNPIPEYQQYHENVEFSALYKQTRISSANTLDVEKLFSLLAEGHLGENLRELLFDNSIKPFNLKEDWIYE